MVAARDADLYTFGDDEVAAHRLALLAELYEPGTRSLLARWAPPQVGHALDLGCGPGHTTRLLHTVTGADLTTGVDRSQQYVEQARAQVLPGIRYVRADVTGIGMPVEPADLVHTRFLLTHLADPAGAIRTWSELLLPGGRLLLQETARLVSREPALGRYYELVAELQARYGQALDVGSRLEELAGRSGLSVAHSTIREFRPPTAAMAALHVLNLRTWRHDAYARMAFDPDELDALDAALTAIAHGAPAAPIEQAFGELVLVAG